MAKPRAFIFDRSTFLSGFARNDSAGPDCLTHTPSARTVTVGARGNHEKGCRMAAA